MRYVFAPDIKFNKIVVNKMFTDAFPIEYQKEVALVSKAISLKTYNNIEIIQSTEMSSWLLPSGETITFPYRIYLIDNIDNPNAHFSKLEQTIYHCIFSRSCDGFVREKHITALLQQDIPDWVIPYILKVCDEYIVEILELVYKHLCNTDTTQFKKICMINLVQFRYGHSRMISYWNEFYRDRCYYYKDYVGKSLYKDCFGYTRSIDKIQIK